MGKAQNKTKDEKMQNQFATPKNVRGSVQTLAGRFRGGKMAPVMAVAVGPNESGILRQEVEMSLDPIAGRMITPITREIYAVYVPVQAMDALKNPEEAFAGNDESIRQKLLSGAPLFDLEPEGELSQRMGVHPVSIGGVKKVSESLRLAHNCAVNYLRRKLYVDAIQLDASNTSVTPALLGSTALTRLNGVLDPEDRVNGSVEIDFGSIKIPMKGIATSTSATYQSGSGPVAESDGTTRSYDNLLPIRDTAEGRLYVEENPEFPGFPNIYGDMDGLTSTGISLTDFYEAEKMDKLVRQLRKMVTDNPEYGEEMIANYVHGLDVNTGRQPFILHKSTGIMDENERYGSDGPSLDISQTDMGLVTNFTVAIPKTEFGGVIVTFAVVKPDETISAQPHPFFTEPWTAINYAADEFKLDPVPVTIRELDGDCESSEEGTVVLYTGNNELKRKYQSYGFTRNTDMSTVEHKTAVWQYEIPASVTPQGVLYPEELDHYPFADQDAEVCQYVVTSVAEMRTPLTWGPSPVENLSSLDDGSILDET